MSLNMGSQQETDWNASKLYNDPPKTITNDAADHFIDAISSELALGYGFVPLIGAGLSAPSGAPLVFAITPYLERCIALALGIEATGMRPWNPRTDQWPPFIQPGTAPTHGWLTEVQVAFDQRRHNPSDPELPVFQEAIGAMAEWRTALQFLSRVVRDKRGHDPDSQDLLALDAPDQGVIDAALRHLMKGREPTLGHRMLATLGGLLRLDILLTTNFDDLLERAFADARNPLTASELHLNSALPPWSALSPQRSLLKLHGNRHSLRADYTLDILPSHFDRCRFLEYLLSADGRQKMWHRINKGDLISRLPFQNHLLVMGFSASDRRTRSFIEYAWTHLDQSFKVYWICHSQQDVARVRKFTQEFKATFLRYRQTTASTVINGQPSAADDSLNSSWQGSHILRFPHIGLLCLQVYQTLRRGLPVAGIIFPSVSRLAVPPMPKTSAPTRAGTLSVPAALPVSGQSSTTATAPATPMLTTLATTTSTETTASMFAGRIEESMKRLRADYSQATRLVVATSLPKARGLTSVCAQVFQRCEEAGDMCLWLDMNDISSTTHLFEQLLDAVNYCLGIEFRMPVYIALTPRAMADEVQRLANSTRKNWVIFLNARETPGANVELGPIETDRDPGNGWMDLIGTDNQKDLPEFLAALCGVRAVSRGQMFQSDSSKISVILFCRGLETSIGSGRPGKTPMIEELKTKGMIDEAHWLMSHAVPLEEAQPEAASIAWVGGDPHKGRFLHSLVHMQRTRFLATVWDDATSLSGSRTDSGAPSPQEKYQWVKQLEGLGLIRRKPGGFIWLHSPARNKLRRILGSAAERDAWLQKSHEPVKVDFANWQPHENVAEIHANLANWNRRILSASDAPPAVFEAVYHSCRSAEAILDAVQTIEIKAEATQEQQRRSVEKEREKKKKKAERAVDTIGSMPAERGFYEARDMIESAASLLQTNSFLIQTHWDSRGSCRQLEYVRDRLCNDLDGKLSALQHLMKLAGVADLTKVFHVVRHSIRKLRIRCTEVMRAIAREVGEDKTAYKRQREVRTLLTGHTIEQTDPITAVDLFGSLFDTERYEHCRTEHGKLAEQAKLGLEWIRWWRWNGMLGIASRSYKKARRALFTGLFSITREKEFVCSRVHHENVAVKELTYAELAEEEVPKLIECCQLMKLKILDIPIPPDLWQHVRLEGLRIIEQLLALRMIHSSLTTLRGEGEPGDYDIAAIRKLACLGAKLADQIMAYDHSTDAHFTIQAMWCKSRLLSHDSIASVIGSDQSGGPTSTVLAVATEEGRVSSLEGWHEGMKVLADAEGCLRYGDPRRRGTDLAVIELYRAEVRMWQAAKTSLGTAGNQTAAIPLNFGEIWRHNKFQPKAEHCLLWQTAGRDWKREHFGEESDKRRSDFADGLRKAKALVQDAMRFLTRAEDDLLRRRRSVWWTTWFIHRKLRAIGMSVWATVVEEGTPIPFLGLEAATRTSETAADVLLHDACRMIRVDAYRLARVVEDYAMCAIGLHFRLMFDEDAVRLPERQNKMYENLKWSVEQLKEAEKRRKDWLKSAWPTAQQVHSERDVVKRRKESGNMESEVSKYIKEQVIEWCEETILPGLEKPLTGQFWRH